MFRKILAASAATVCLTHSASAETYGTAQFGQAMQGGYPVTFSIFCCTRGTEELWAFESRVAQAIELPLQYHDIRINTISIGVMPGTEPILYGPGGTYLPASGAGGSWLTFDLGGAPINFNRFVVGVRSATPFNPNLQTPTDSRVFAANNPSSFEGAHIITETYWPAHYTHTQSKYSLLYSVDFTGSTTPVPEASTTAMLALGLIGLGLIVRGSRHRIEREH